MRNFGTRKYYITWLFSILAICSSSVFFSQEESIFFEEELIQIDSLNLIIENSNDSDTNKVASIIALSEILYLDNFDTLLALSLKAVKISEEQIKIAKFKESSRAFEFSKAFGLNNIGYYYDVIGELDTSIYYYNKSLEIREKINDLEGAATCLNNIGFVFKTKGNYPKALENYLKSLSIQEKINNQSGLADVLNNIGLVYDDQLDTELALMYYIESLEIKETLNDLEGMAIGYNNVGTAYDTKGDITKAIFYYEKSLALERQLKNQEGIAYLMNNLGTVYFGLGELYKAEKYYDSSLSIQIEIEDKNGIAYSYANLASTKLALNNLVDAEKNALISLQISKENQMARNTKDAAFVLYEIYSKQNKKKQALENYELFVKMRDSIINDENTNAILQQKYQFEFDKKAAADSVIQIESKKVKEAELAAKKAINDQQEIELNDRKKQNQFLYGGLFLVAIFGLFVFQRYRVTLGQKKIIDIQKKDVENQTVKIELQHNQLEQSLKEVEDSIRYAENLQKAILPSITAVQEVLIDSFVLYNPKDVVSGDFYWMHQFESIQDGFLIAVADCTGHGVPGAMVSVVCGNALNRSVNEFNLVQPSAVLDKTRELVIETFSKSGNDVKDGMDIALCKIKNNQLTFSGANNPLWIVRKTSLITEEQKKDIHFFEHKDYTLIEIKPFKQPIGLYAESSPFPQSNIDLINGDTVYMFTDGYADQFGGPRGKKIKYIPLKTLLIDLQRESMDSQHKKLTTFFDEWKGDLEQIDDVCMIGMKYSSDGA